MLSLNSIRSGYGTSTVLRDLSITLQAGQRTAVLGRNGVGKTTLLQTVMGHIRPTGGTISFDGTDITRLPAHDRARAGIAYVPQGRQIFGNLSVRDNLRVAALGTGVANARELLGEVLDELPALKPKLRDRGGSLSGGQQQILALGRALMTRPRFLMLDEPSEGIQPSILDEIAEIVVSVNESRGITVLIVEQNLDFAAQIAVDAYVVDKGEVVRELPMTELAADVDLQQELMGV